MRGSSAVGSFRSPLLGLFAGQAAQAGLWQLQSFSCQRQLVARQETAGERDISLSLEKWWITLFAQPRRLITEPRVLLPIPSMLFYISLALPRTWPEYKVPCHARQHQLSHTALFRSRSPSSRLWDTHRWMPEPAASEAELRQGGKTTFPLAKT